MSTPAAYICCNGNVLYFDADGEQIIDLQRLGLSGLHHFAERYPDGKIWWCVWKLGRIQDAQEIDKEMLPWLLRHIRRRPGKRPGIVRPVTMGD